MRKKRIILSTLVLIAIISLSILYLYLNNFHTVIPGQVYRGPEASKTQFESMITKDHLKAILNLRQTSTEPWHTEELAAASEAHILHVDLPLNAHALPDLPTLKKTITLVETLPRPFYLHCRRGADRSGMVSAIALLLNDERSIDVVNKQVSLRYFVTASDSVGKQFLHLYECWLTQNKITTSRANFLAWVGQLNASNYPSNPACATFK